MTLFWTVSTYNEMGHHAEDAGRASMTSGDLMTQMTSDGHTWEEG